MDRYILHPGWFLAHKFGLPDQTCLVDLSGQKLSNIFMLLTVNQIHCPRDSEACKHNFILVGKLAWSHLATPFPVGMS